ncbi:hypothetical protein E4T80_08265 [Muribacter muris]|uniref:Transferrin-binding protein B C-lobe/N-lobe beta-barrel domain-containing protein n=1 Tax=Muribacter muris TaxID=67855 RepID=A0A4Y9JV03_9PAST|nr:transferrin-binding protein-like solute binding protein [Muribacter muris]MBF0785451.1 transferrin-binding protein-like solute binding protein [Muribacter muris]MBF0828099.1 transferrin-binding protein-like solute binding protein [Muribacter muris]TFV09581.1 hypothetical protein E4T80_08265 [Muribacter muris]
MNQQNIFKTAFAILVSLGVVACSSSHSDTSAKQSEKHSLSPQQKKSDGQVQSENTPYQPPVEEQPKATPHKTNNPTQTEAQPHQPLAEEQPKVASSKTDKPMQSGAQPNQPLEKEQPKATSKTDNPTQPETSPNEAAKSQPIADKPQSDTMPMPPQNLPQENKPQLVMTLHSSSDVNDTKSALNDLGQYLDIDNSGKLIPLTKLNDVNHALLFNFNQHSLSNNHYQAFGTYLKNEDNPMAFSVGYHTPQNAIPTSGKVDYYGAAITYTADKGYTPHAATFTANVDFAEKTIDLNVENTVNAGVRTPEFDFKATAKLAADRNHFEGTLTPSTASILTEGTIKGAFYGSKAEEIGGTFDAKGKAYGAFGGRRE